MNVNWFGTLGRKLAKRKRNPFISPKMKKTGDAFFKRNKKALYEGTLAAYERAIREGKIKKGK